MNRSRWVLLFGMQAAGLALADEGPISAAPRNSKLNLGTILSQETTPRWASGRRARRRESASEAPRRAARPLGRAPSGHLAASRRITASASSPSARGDRQARRSTRIWWIKDETIAGRHPRLQTSSKTPRIPDRQLPSNRCCANDPRRALGDGGASMAHASNTPSTPPARRRDISSSTTRRCRCSASAWTRSSRPRWTVSTFFEAWMLKVGDIKGSVAATWA